MLHKISINKKWQDKVEKPGEKDYFPWTQFTNTFEIVEDLAVDEIAELCRRNVPLCNPFDQIPVPGEKTAKHDVNFVQYSFFQEDIDGTFNLQELHNDPFVQQYGSLILSSFNNAPHDPRGKVLYFLEEPITDIETAKTFAKAMLKKRKEITAPDASTKDPLRLCFTCNPNTAEVHVLKNLMPANAVDEIIAEYEEWLAELKEAANKQRSYANANADVFSEDGAYTHNLSNVWDYFNARIDLSTLPEVFGYTPCGENRWTRPNGNNPGGLVLIENEFYYTHSANDPVYQVLNSLGIARPDCFNAFFMIAALKYEGDFKAAYAREVDAPYRFYENWESPAAVAFREFMIGLAAKRKAQGEDDQHTNGASEKASDSTNGKIANKTITHSQMVSEVLKYSYLANDQNGNKYIVLPQSKKDHGKKVVTLQSDDAFEFYSQVYSLLTGKSGLYYTDTKFPASLGTVKGKPEQVYQRWAMVTNPDGSQTLWHDLNRPDRIGIKIDGNEWSAEPLNEVLFVYNDKLQECPMPVRNGTPFIQFIDKYMQVLTPEDRVLITAILVSYMIASKTNIITMLFGKSGSGKSSVAKIMSLFMKYLNSSEGLVQGNRDFTERQIIAFLNNNCHLTYDNVSEITDSVSDILCTISSGACYSTRKLHTDGELFSISKSAPILITAVEDQRGKADLQNRAYIFKPTKLKKNKKTDSQLWKLIYKDFPEMLGSLYDLVVMYMKYIDQVSEDTNKRDIDLTRMADFAQCGMSIEAELQKGECAFSSFLMLANKKRQEMAGSAISKDALAFYTHKILSETEGSELTITPTDFVNLVNEKRSADNPKADVKQFYPNHVVGRLIKLAPTLSDYGIEFEAPEPEISGTTRYIYFTKLENTFDASATSGGFAGDEDEQSRKTRIREESI